MNTDTLETLKRELRQEEGVVKFPYTDTVGKTTIGVGRNLTDVGLSDTEVDFLFTNDLNTAISSARQLYYQFDALPQTVQRALVNMAFNLGMGGLKSFRKMAAAIHHENWEQAAAECLDSKAAHQLPNRYQRIAGMFRDAA